MRVSNVSACVAAAVVASALALPALATPVGSSWILKIDHTQNGTFVDPGGGYNGDPSASHTGSAGDIARVYWVVPNTVDPSPQLYKIEWWTSQTDNGYQPFEVQYNGVAGDSAGFDPNIPWHGQFSTNHQYVGNNGANLTGVWNSTGPGPQSPGDASDGTQSSTDPRYPANPDIADGSSVWLKPGSEIFVKWDFGFYNQQENTVSDLRLTQVTPTPEPAALSILLAGAGLTLLRRRRRPCTA